MQGLGEAIDLGPPPAKATAPLVGEALALFESGRRAILAGDAAGARALFDDALDLAPGSAALIQQKGVTFLMEGRLDEGCQWLHEAVAASFSVSALCDLATAERMQDQLESAQAHYSLALSGAPDLSVAWEGLGYVKRQLDDHAAAVQCLRRALPGAGDRRATILCELIHSLQYLAAWSEIERLKPQLEDAMRTSDCEVASFPLLSLAGLEACHLKAARSLVLDRRKRVSAVPAPFSPRSDERLRIGYLSSDFFEHATARLIVEVLERHDRDAVEVVLLDHGPDDGTPMRRRLEAAADRLVRLGGLSHDDAAQRIRAQGIDVLVDLKGNTANARPDILVRRPAPIIVHWLGYPGPLGGLVDAIIGDPIVMPPGAEVGYDETLVRLPVCYQPNDSARPVGTCPSRVQLGLPEAGVVFCGFNASYKIGREVWRRWMRILNATPGSVLWLLQPSDATAAVYRREASYAGVDPGRIVFAPWLGWRDYANHLARHQAADLFLDASPYGAHTTASDALWAGLPALTFVGEGFASRVTASLLHFLDMDDLIAGSPEAHVEQAIALGRDPLARERIRARLEAGRHRPGGPFDSSATASALEAAYQALYRDWAEGSATAKAHHP